MSDESPQVIGISRERQNLANKVAAVFNSLDNFLHTLAHEGEGGVGKVYSKYLEHSLMRLSESANHAVKHVLMFGAPAGFAAANDGAPAAADTPPPSQTPPTAPTPPAAA